MREIGTRSELLHLWTDSSALICEFRADWCGLCSRLEALMMRIEKENPQVIRVVVDVEKHKWLAEEFHIEILPTLFFVRKGRVVELIAGRAPDRILRRIVKNLTLDKGETRDLWRVKLRDLQSKDAENQSKELEELSSAQESSD